MNRPLPDLRAPAEPLPDAATPDQATPSRAEATAPDRAVASTLVEEMIERGLILTSFLKNKAHTCCAGVDVPGVGHTHAFDCPAVARRATIAGAPCREGEVPPALRRFLDGDSCHCSGSFTDGAIVRLTEADFAEMRAIEQRDVERDRLLGQLVFAARELALESIHSRGLGAVDSTVPWCWKCQIQEHLGSIRHRATCSTGRVLGIIEKLCKTLQTNPLEEGGAAAEETAGAGDGIRLRGLDDLVCIKCGQRGGAGWSWEPAVGALDLSLLGLNQVAKSCGATDHAIFTHDCAAVNGSYRVSGVRDQAAGAMDDEMWFRGGAQ